MNPKIRVRLLLVLALVVGSAGCSLLKARYAPPTEARTFSQPESGVVEPFGIATYGGDLFVSDGQAGVIWKIGRDGKTSEFVRGFATPSHIDFDSIGNLYVADSGDHTIRRVSTEGNVELVAGISGKRGFRNGPAKKALFNSPIGIAVQKDTVFVADTYNDRIRIIENERVRTLSGRAQGFADGPNGRFNTPSGIAVTKDSVLVADTGNRRIRLVEMDGSASTIAGGGAKPDGLLADAGFAGPVDIAVDQTGTILVTDGDRLRAIGRRFIPVVETISGGDRGFGDGGVRQARFNRLSGLAVAENGDIFAADSDNSLVRVLTGNGTGVELSGSDFEKNRMTIGEFRKKGPPRWPYEPPSRKREIAGTLGEIRGEIKDRHDQAWFHNGLDITGTFGETGYIIRDETILLPLAVSEFGTKRENVRFPEIGYVHLNLGRDSDGKAYRDGRFQFRFDGNGRPAGLRIPRGSRFRPGDSLGTLNAMNHIHLIAGFSGREFNALNAQRLPGVLDSRAPVIENIRLLTEDWSDIETESGAFRIKKDARYRLVVTAYDQMDGNPERRRLGVYKLGYQFLDIEGTPLAGKAIPEWTLFFSRTPPQDAVSLVYAPGSKSGATGKTVFNYIVSNKVTGKTYRESYLDLPGNTGAFILRVFAADFFGNVASNDIRIEID